MKCGRGGKAGDSSGFADETRLAVACFAQAILRCQKQPPKSLPTSEIFPCSPGFEIIHVGLGSSPIPTIVGYSVSEAVFPKHSFEMS